MACSGCSLLLGVLRVLVQEGEFRAQLQIVSVCSLFTENIPSRVLVPLKRQMKHLECGSAEVLSLP